MSIGEPSSDSSNKTMGKRSGKRAGRKPSKIDERAKLERSRQSARECRARKKLRYQYLEELVLNREKAVYALRDELETYKQWCTVLDRGDPVPDSLLKMLVSESMSQKQVQIEQSKRSLLQQQQQQRQQQSQVSSTSSSSPESSPPHLSGGASSSQHKGSLHEPSSTSSTSDLSRYLPNLSPPLQPELHHKPSQPCSSKQKAKQPFDSSKLMNIQHSDSANPAVPTVVQILAHGSGSRVITFSHLQQQQQQLKMQQLITQQRLRSRNTSVSSSTLPSRSLLHQDCPTSSNIAETKLDQSFKYQRPFNIHSGDSEASLLPSSVSIKSDSVTDSTSTPLMSLPRFPSKSTQSLSQILGISQAHPGSSAQHSSGYDSLYTKFLPESSNESASLNIPLSLTAEESGSDEDNENVNEQSLFQSTVYQKRMLLEPTISSDHKRSKPSTNVASTLSTMSYDPQVTLSNLTKVQCFGATRTSSVPSPSPLGLVLSRASSPSPSPLGLVLSRTSSPSPSLLGMVSPRAPSPSSTSRFTSKHSSTASSSATASPAPLSSLSSLLELSDTSPGLSSATFDPSLEMTDSTMSSYITESSNPVPVQCSSTGLRASISEPIPEWYSFLADLEDEGMTTLTSRHGASSNNSTHMVLTPKPLTSIPAYLNVPKIIDEFLESDDQD